MLGLVILGSLCVAPPQRLAADTAEDDGPKTVGIQNHFVSPYSDRQRSLEFLDAVGRRLVFNLRYEPESCDAQPWGATPDFTGRRCFRRTLPKPAAGDGDAKTARLGIFLFPRLEAGYELFFLGDILGSAEANPDLSIVQTQITDLTSSTATVGGRHDDFLVYPLSYVQTDRAVATLKSLGYPVIEYTAPKGQTSDPKPAAKDVIFGESPVKIPGRRRPLIINMIDSQRTTLVPSGGSGGTGGKVGGEGDTINLGGQPLDDITAGVPQQRLMIVFDTQDTSALHTLLDHLRLRIDVPARQILIEAQVIELDVDYLRELGVSFDGSKDGNSFQFQQSGQGLEQPFVYTFQRPSIKTLLNLNVSIAALVDAGNARVLSRPSVLVLDGRQARIQVGSKIPFTSGVTLTDGGNQTFATKYLNVGIALNLRPRANRDNSEVTMQVETLISSAGPSAVQSATNTIIAPPILSREVQSLVRVANDTPFIIGGLISASEQTTEAGIPGLRRIPWLGRLFRRDNTTRDRTEVIVVITPHIIPVEDRSFSYTIPKDSEIFDSFDTVLFRNLYRLRNRDILDFDFITESEFYRTIARKVLEHARNYTEEASSQLSPASPRSPSTQTTGGAQASPLHNVNPNDAAALAQSIRMLVEHDDLADGPPCRNGAAPCSEAYATFLENRIPGEDILVKRMLLRVIRRLDLDDYLPLDNIIYFSHPGNEGSEDDDTPERRLDSFFAPANPAGQPVDIAQPILEVRTDLADLLGALEPNCSDDDAWCTVDSVCQSLGMAFRDEPLPSAGQIQNLPNLPTDSRELVQRHLQRVKNGIDPNHLSFDPPRALLVEMDLVNAEYLEKLRTFNKSSEDPTKRWEAAFLLLNHCYGAVGEGTNDPIERLKQVLVLERVLALNPSLPLTLEGFHVGREIVFPTAEDLGDIRYLVDRQTAELFYETLDYYYAFEKVFRQAISAPDVQNALGF